mmetsp:Transcript_12620/g.20560  ORF Transcript_12620/g.20560 Transcript_12620/m.20560 type:complete len:1083 (+) Transcript_12620:185-3433(+)|eukprot:CAMPEP_0184671582 /NCGR_PEP_ID=MMETSP0308-20130426/85585_1 /TAXON_ID=38269 /ORGANISM="Gloeochaete witrockiana, Strain SAG 46.84" /LENGTH=1082 /DNA_ID=CAMNT_0027118745 /DNA_START=147 /DNA_END=3395 /DNA_ORIENTATION=-
MKASLMLLKSLLISLTFAVLLLQCEADILREADALNSEGALFEDALAGKSIDFADLNEPISLDGEGLSLGLSNQRHLSQWISPYSLSAAVGDYNSRKQPLPLRLTCSRGGRILRFSRAVYGNGECSVGVVDELTKLYVGRTSLYFWVGWQNLEFSSPPCPAPRMLNITIVCGSSSPSTPKASPKAPSSPTWKRAVTPKKGSTPTAKVPTKSTPPKVATATAKVPVKTTSTPKVAKATPKKASPTAKAVAPKATVTSKPKPSSTKATVKPKPSSTKPTVTKKASSTKPTVTRKPSSTKPTVTRKPSATKPTRKPSFTKASPSVTRRPTRTKRPSALTKKPIATAKITVTRKRTRRPTRIATAVKFTPKRVRTPVPRPEPTQKPGPVIKGFDSTKIRYTLDTPEFVFYPSEEEKHYPDMAAVDMHLPNKQIRAYSGKGKTDLIVKGSSLGNTLSPKYRLNIMWDPPDYYTNVLEAVQYDATTGIAHGWVHIETWTGDRGGTWFHGEITYTKSLDSGITWSPYKFTKADYTVSSAGPYFYKRLSTGCGAHWVVGPEGPYYYMYYVDMWAEQPDGSNAPGRCIARATKTSGGAPGTWNKFYRGSWSEPGVRYGLPQEQQGYCSAIEVAGTATSYVCTTNTRECFWVNIPPSFIGRIMASKNGYSGWTSLGGVFLPNFVARTAGQSAIANTWYQGYQSILKDENSEYWMYAFIISEDTTHRRAIVRQRIKFEKASVDGCSGRIALTYWSQVGTGIVRLGIKPTDDRSWNKLRRFGYASTCYGRMLTRLVECAVSSSDRYFLATDEECTASKRAPDGSRLRYVGPAGQVRNSPKAGLDPLYRCYDTARKAFNYDIKDCEDTANGIRSKLLGYMMKANSDWSADLSSLGEDPFYDPDFNMTANGYDTYSDPLWDTTLSAESREELLQEAETTGLVPGQSSGPSVTVIAVSVSLAVATVSMLAIAAVVLIRRRRLQPDYRPNTPSPSSRPARTPTRTPKGKRSTRADRPFVELDQRATTPGTPTSGRSKEVVGLPPLRVAWFEEQQLYFPQQQQQQQQDLPKPSAPPAHADNSSANDSAVNGPAPAPEKA